MDDYSGGELDLNGGFPPEALVDDVLRCKVILPETQNIVDLQTYLKKSRGCEFKDEEQHVKLRLLRTRNRFRNLGVTQFRHIMNKFELSNGTQSLLCEMRVQHEIFSLLDDKMDSHYHYSYFRSALED